MRTSRRILYVALCLSVAAGACWHRCADTNHDRAYFTREAHVFRVELAGRRFPLVHDPVSLLTASTREESFTLELPRIEGVIEGAEIHHTYLGRVTIASGRMTVDLYYRDEDRGRQALSWNGTYTLVQKTAVTR